MERGIRLIISGPNLETKSPEEFEDLVRRLGAEGLGVKVQRTRAVLAAERREQKKAALPKFDPEKKALLRSLTPEEFRGLLIQEGLSQRDAGAIWNGLADYSLPHPHNKIDYDYMPEDFTPIITDDTYKGDYKDWRESSEIWALHADSLRRLKLTGVAVNMQALATAIENGYLGNSPISAHSRFRLGQRRRDGLMRMVEGQIASVGDSTAEVSQ